MDVESSSTIGAKRIVGEARSILAEVVRTRVVGPDAAARAQQIFDADGERWFAEDRPIRTIHADASMFVGGLRALLLQSLHPRAMAGVAQHSDYRNDPWGRLQRTADFLAATTFGPRTEAERAIATVRRVHTRVTGTTSDGRRYDANDPHLLKWVHIAEADSFVRAHRRFGSVRLTASDYDRYVADMAVVAEHLGVIEPPRSVRQLAHQLQDYRAELHGTPEARSAARYLLVTPPLPMAVRPAYGILGAAAVSLLPLWARRPLLLPWFPVSERAVVRPAGEALVRALRWALTDERVALRHDAGRA